MLVLRRSNFQGATNRPIVPKQKQFIVFIIYHKIVFRTPCSLNSVLNYFQLFSMKTVRVKCKFGQRKQTKTSLTIQFQLFIFYEPAHLWKRFNGQVLLIQVISSEGHMG